MRAARGARPKEKPKIHRRLFFSHRSAPCVPPRGPRSNLPANLISRHAYTNLQEFRAVLPLSRLFSVRPNCLLLRVPSIYLLFALSAHPCRATLVSSPPSPVHARCLAVSPFRSFYPSDRQHPLSLALSLDLFVSPRLRPALEPSRSVHAVAAEVDVRQSRISRVHAQREPSLAPDGWPFCSRSVRPPVRSFVCSFFLLPRSGARQSDRATATEKLNDKEGAGRSGSDRWKPTINARSCAGPVAHGVIELVTRAGNVERRRGRNFRGKTGTVVAGRVVSRPSIAMTRCF